MPDFLDPLASGNNNLNNNTAVKARKALVFSTRRLFHSITFKFRVVSGPIRMNEPSSVE